MSVSFEVYVFVLIIAALAFFPMRFLASKVFASRRNAFISSVIGSLLAAPILYVSLVMVIYSAMTYYPSKEFTSEGWIAAGPKVEHGDNIPPTRYLYSEDLVERGLLIGKTKEEVIDLLGEPDSEMGTTLSYNLGFVPGHGIDPDFLRVYFENGVVIKAEQRRS